MGLELGIIVGKIARMICQQLIEVLYQIYYAYSICCNNVNIIKKLISGTYNWLYYSNYLTIVCALSPDQEQNDENRKNIILSMYLNVIADNY